MKAIHFLSVLCLLSACEQAKMNNLDGARQMSEQTKSELSNPLAQSTNASELSLATIAIRSGEAVHNFSAEVAVSEEEREKGLQNRQSLPGNFGMWFIFPAEVNTSFWMKDTFIPLDLIFVGSNYRVVDLIENAVPQSEDLLSSDAPYQYVLEVNAGKVHELGIAVGDVVEYRVGPAE